MPTNGDKKSNGSRIIDKLIISKHLERKVCTDNRREIVVSVNSSIDSNHFCTKTLLKGIFPNWDMYEEQELTKIIRDLETLNKVL